MAERPDPRTRIDEVKSDIVVIGKNLLDLAKAEAKPRAVDAGLMSGAFGAAGYLMANGASLLFLAGAAGLAGLFSLWYGPYAAVALGLVAMAVLLFIVAAVLAWYGKSRIPRLKKPLQTVAAAQNTAAEVKSSITQGQHLVETEIENSRHPAITQQ